MAYLRIRVAGLIGLVAATGVGMAACTSPTAELTAGLFTAAGASLVFSILAVVYRSREHRAFWAGFALFGWAYIVSCYGPVVGSAVRPRLLTTYLIDRLYVLMNPRLQETFQSVVAGAEGSARSQWHIRFDQEDDPNADSVVLTAVGKRRTTESYLSFYLPVGSDNLVWFRRSGQAVITLWVALCGGIAGRYLYATREGQRQPHPERAGAGELSSPTSGDC